MRRFYFLLLLFLAAVQQATAQQGEDYINMELPAEWNYNEYVEQVLPVDDQWWRNFEDPVLDSLIVAASENNYSVLGAMENIRKARAAWLEARGGMLPTFDFSFGWQRAKTSGNIASTMYNETWEGEFSTGVSMQWQADVFGTIYMRSKAQKMLFMATEEEYSAVMVTLIANVASTYFSLRQSLAQMQVIRWNVESQREIMNIVESRYESGLASKLDVAQSRSVYYSTMAQIPAMQATIESYRNAMAVLLGVYPQELVGWLSEGYALPVYTEIIGTGMPAQLILRRPDLRAAEKQVEANAALLGATKRDWFPKVLLTGSIGFASHDLKHLPRSKSLTWEIAPSITWNIFSGGERVNATRQARAELDRSITSYNSALLNAVQEVENAISQYSSSLKQIEVLREAMNQNRETLTLSLELYKQGLTEYQNVLDAQRSLLTCQDYLVQAHGSSLIYLVQIYEALGGGW